MRRVRRAGNHSISSVWHLGIATGRRRSRRVMEITHCSTRFRIGFGLICQVSGFGQGSDANSIRATLGTFGARPTDR
jgi:hypothetical protein